MRNTLRRTCLTLLPLLAQAATGQTREAGHALQSEQPKFDLVNAELSSKQCKALMQDSEGYVWIGTANGVTRYDGINCHTFGTQSKGEKGDFDRSVMTMTEDTASRCIWAAMENSRRLMRIDLRTFSVSFLSYDIPSDATTPESAKIVHSLAPLTDSTLICRTMSGYYTLNKRSGHTSLLWACPDGKNTPRTGFMRVGGKTYNVGNGRLHSLGAVDTLGRVDVEQVQVLGPHGLPLQVKDAEPQSDTTLLLVTFAQGTKFDLMEYDIRSGHTRRETSTVAPPRGFCRSDDGLWTATSRGLSFWRRRDGRTFTFTTGNSSLHDNRLTCMLKVRNQPIFFIGTNDGLVKLDYFASKFQRTDMRRYSPSRNAQVWSIAKDSHGNTWAGCVDGLFFRPSDNMYFTQVEIPQTDKSQPTWILNIDETKERDGLVACTSRAVFALDHTGRVRKTLVGKWHNKIRSMQTLAGGRVALTTETDVSVIDGRSGALLARHESQAGDRITMGRTDDGKTMWLACRDGRLRRMDLRSGRMETEATIDRTHGNINTLRHSRQRGVDELWIVTSLGHLLYKNPGYDRIRRIDNGEILSDKVRSVEIDARGNTWVATDAGLAQIKDGTTQEFKAPQFDICGQFINRSTNRGANGEILLGGRNDFVEFWPEWFETNDYYPVPQLSSYVLANSTGKDYDIFTGKEKLYGGGVIEIPAGIRSILLKFRSLNYSRPDDNEIEWSMDGEPLWHLTGSGGEVALTSIAEGAHKISARTLDARGLPSGGKMTIIINKEVFFYEKRAFAAVSALLVVMGVATIMVWKNQQIKMISHRMQREVGTMQSMLVTANNEMRRNQAIIKRQNKELAAANANLEDVVAERTRELAEAKLKAEESNQLKSAFLANLGHEVRTPMNAIVGFAKLLQTDDCTDEERAEFAHLILESSHSMLSLLGALLDTSRIERGLLEISWGKVDVYREIKDTWRILSVEKKNKNVTFGLELDEALQGVVMDCDKDRLRQIIINLTYNAFKFTPKGSVTLRARRIAASELELHNAPADLHIPPADDGLLLVSVADTGIGIPPDKTEVIFEPFRRLNSGKGKIAGLGLGLNIVRSLTHLLGGQVWLTSHVEVGSTFYFYLPLRRP